ncbi:MAG: hypothetical protein WCK57_09385, partial [Verrucomicrobiae bacterium]
FSKPAPSATRPSLQPIDFNVLRLRFAEALLLYSTRVQLLQFYRELSAYENSQRRLTNGQAIRQAW